MTEFIHVTLLNNRCVNFNQTWHKTFLGLFVWRISPIISRIFHSYGDINIFGKWLQFFTSRLGFEHPTFRLRSKRSSPRRHRHGALHDAGSLSLFQVKGPWFKNDIVEKTKLKKIFSWTSGTVSTKIDTKYRYLWVKGTGLFFLQIRNIQFSKKKTIVTLVTKFM